MKIGIFSSSSPVSVTVPARYERGYEYLSSKGYEVVNGNLYGRKDFYRSGSIKERAEEFNALLHDVSIDVLMAAIGGNNTNSILPYIDYEHLRKNPKIIIGYSDTTALLLSIYAKTGLNVFYGPALASSFGEFPPFVDLTYDYFENMVMNKISVPYEFPFPEFWTDEFIDWGRQDRSKEKYPNKWITVNGGKITGRLVGGNLNTMEGFFGTEYMPRINEGDILFIEDSLKNACTIERSFSLLKLAGVFERAGGIILGKHEKFDDMGTGLKPYEILQEVLGGKNIPFLADFDCCHTHPMFTLPIGLKYTLDAGNKKLLLEEKVPILR